MTATDSVSVPLATAAVAGEVRALVARNRTRQSELCALLGLSQGSVSLRLSGRVPFTVEEIVQVASYFDVQPGQMLQAALDNWRAAAMSLPRLDSNQ